MRLIREIARWGALTVEQICGLRDPELLFHSRATAYGRLKALARAGYLEFQRPFFRSPRQPFIPSREFWTGWVPFPGPGVYVVTWTGMRQIGQRPLPPTKITTLRRLRALRTHLFVVDLATWLMQQHPGTVWLTHREMLREAMAQVRQRSGCLLDGAGHVPEGLLSFPSTKRVAVELDLSPRPRRVYERIVAVHINEPRADQVHWYASDTDETLDIVERVVRDRNAGDRIRVIPPPQDLGEHSPWWSSWFRNRAASR